MPSVARQIFDKLFARLQAINGAGDFINNVSAAVFARRPSYDAEAEPVPAVFIHRRVGADQRSDKPGEGFPEHQVTYDVIGVVPAGANAGQAAEDLLADIERALEIESDKCLRDSATGLNLLSQELRLTGAEVDPPKDGSKLEAIAVGVICTYPHKYGNPDFVCP